MRTLAKWLLVLIALITLNGCATFGQKIQINPIQDSDIHTMKKGTIYTAPKDGYFLSQLFFDEVEHAKVNELKKIS